MTMIHPAATGVGKLLNGIGIKTLAVGVLGLVTWHFTDAADIRTLNQKTADQDKTLEIQREALTRKVDSETYAREQRELMQQLHEIRLSQGRVEQILMERAK